jgi:TolB-like protein
MAMKRFVVFGMMLIASGAYAAAPAKVLLLPFDSVGPAEKQWVAKALQQNLVAELSRVNSVEPVVGTTVVDSIEAALKAAADAKADYVIFGSYQAVDADLRMTGQVVDVSKRQAVAGLKSTGTQRDLFGMEDIIANQVKRSLPQPVAVAQPEMLQQPPAQPAPVVQPAPPVDVNAQARELEAQIDRAIDRLRYSSDQVYYPDDNYFYSGIYTPYYSYPFYGYPSYAVRRHHHYYNSGSGISGSYHNGNLSVNFSTGGGYHGGGSSLGRNYNVSTTANYANFGRMTMQTPHR